MTRLPVKDAKRLESDCKSVEGATVAEKTAMRFFKLVVGASAKFTAESSEDWKQLFETTGLWRAG